MRKTAAGQASPVEEPTISLQRGQLWDSGRGLQRRSAIMHSPLELVPALSGPVGCTMARDDA